MFKIRARGDWSPRAVRVAWTDSTRASVPEVERAMEQAWGDATARGGTKLLFDGPMCRLESFDVRPDSLHLVLSLTSYKEFYGTNMCDPGLADRHGAGVLANPVGLSTALVSSDGFFLLGRRNASVAYYPNRLHPFAGALEPSDDVDVFEGVRRELHEELGLRRDEVVDLRCIGIVEDDALRQPELIFAARATSSRDEIASRLDPKEHRGLWSVPATRDALASATTDPTQFTPVALATIALWSSVSSGER
jgi:8-oxo-dGTP pyrophosphatase MutT (NUDIX family)